jgi:hypothetical protein
MRKMSARGRMLSEEIRKIEYTLELCRQGLKLGVNSNPYSSPDEDILNCCPSFLMIGHTELTIVIWELNEKM